MVISPIDKSINPIFYIKEYFDYEIDHLYLEQEPMLFGKFVLKEKKKNIKFREKEFERDVRKFMKDNEINEFSMSESGITLCFNLITN